MNGHYRVIVIGTVTIVVSCWLFVAPREATAQWPARSTPQSPKLPGQSETPRRTAAPTEAEQEAKRKLVRELYEGGYTSDDRDQRRLVAAKMLRDADATRDDPVGRYVLYEAAAEVAANSGGAYTVIQASRRLIDQYEVDAFATRLRLLGVVTGPTSDMGSLRLSRAYHRLIDEAIAADGHDTAQQAISDAEKFARRYRDKDLTGEMRQARKRLGQIRRQHGQVMEAYKRLAADPDDASDNDQVGAYLCFVKGDWPAGLLHLAKGSDPAVQSAAKQEMSRPTDAQAWATLGDGWLAAGKAERNEPQRIAMLRRALRWYEQAEPKLQGLAREGVTHKIDEADALLSELTDEHRSYERGLIVTYFRKPASKVRKDEVIFAERLYSTVERRPLNFSWARSAPAPGVPADHFTCRYEGYLLAARSGDYLLRVRADDWCRLKVAGKTVLATARTGKWATARVKLPRGRHAFVAEVCEDQGNATVQVYWRGSDSPKPIAIPAGYFEYEARQGRRMNARGVARAR